ncbi:MAG: HpsJ family protein [Cyanobacteria bacterium P01_G01_bin.54]
MFTSLALKVVGVIMIISSLVDYLILAIPFSPLNPEWQIAFINQIVDRGIIPMVGIAFLVAGYWVAENVSGGSSGKINFTDLRFWSFLLASLLGLMFLVFIPLHISTLGKAKKQAMLNIEQSAVAAETQIEGQLDAVEQLLGDTARQQELAAAIDSGQIEGAQLEQLVTIQDQIDQLKQDPTALETQADEARSQLETRRKEAEQQANLTAFKSGVRIGLSSLLLSVGYILIGWNGFRGLAGGGGAAPRRRTAMK